MTDTTPYHARLAGEIARQIDQLAGHLVQAPPREAAQIIATVLDPDGGVLGRITTLLATASHYAKDRTENRVFPPEVWLALGRAANELHDVGLDLDAYADTFRQLARRTAAGGTAPPPKPADGSAPGRGR
ncbi:hypothetical protein [Streptomyces uncialis]|uniref:hypothetical protein n=1 Tax=Streptomyces uncialis TaxID=1048205 RepID=UPI00386AADFF|nr:hypothetical protein OG924_29570 [Streptomyces uncialis]